MLKAIVLEGPRGTGKSTVTRLLRETIDGATLINMTGFKTDGAEGLAKITDYYTALFDYLKTLSDSPYTFVVIFDRTFFSEMVYAPIYKSYDFTPIYNRLLKLLFNCTDSLHLFFLKVSDTNVLSSNLNRDKVLLFDQVEESITQSMKQQQYYETLFESIEEHFVGKERCYKVIDTSYLSPIQVKEVIMEALTCPNAEEERLM